MRIRNFLNIILNILKLKSISLTSIIVTSFLLLSCSMVSQELPPIIEEAPVKPNIVWDNFIQQYQDTSLLPFKMKVLAKLQVHGITRRFTIFGIGNGEGVVKMDILTSGMNVAKIAETPTHTTFYFPTMKRAYIIDTQDISGIEVLAGFSLPFSLNTLTTWLSGSLPTLFSSHSTNIPREGMIEYILPDKSQLFLSYSGHIIKWRNSHGWEITPLYDSNNRQKGLVVLYTPKGYRIEYLIEKIEDLGYVEPTQFYLKLPPNTPIYTMK